MTRGQHVVRHVIRDRQVTRRRAAAEIFDGGIAAVVVLRLELEAGRIALDQAQRLGEGGLGRHALDEAGVAEAAAQDEQHLVQDARA